MIDRKIELVFDEKNKQFERYALKFRRDCLFYSFYFQYIFDFYFQKQKMNINMQILKCQALFTFFFSSISVCNRNDYDTVF